MLTSDVFPSDLDKPKTDLVGVRCKSVSPQTAVLAAHQATLQDLPLDAFADADVVILAVDNLDAWIEMASRRIRDQILMVVAVEPKRLAVQVRTFSNHSLNAPCLICGLSRRSLLDARTLKVEYSCEGNNSPSIPVERPTRSLSFLCSLAADFALGQLLRCVLDLGKQRVCDRLWEFCVYSGETRSWDLPESPDCYNPHVLLDPLYMPVELDKMSVRELTKEASLPNNGTTTLWLDGGLVWAKRASCGCGGRSRRTNSFVRRGEEFKCPTCLQPLRFDRFHSYAEVPLSVLPERLFDQPLSTLGASGTRTAIVRNGDKAVLLRQHSVT